ncbi:TPA: glycosyltransferase family 4 protein [Candidatus Woesearchaeota archaeon]|nr:glycosyltransferase family 4 protein [Candidatus Woesearchaeota archaeon]HIH31153.1 glycosyltransferase family 4 protein [Candidatus Woesearchaeota archaeon]HIH54634.1 glycosyltransferase family 4 protein [Candidatus Woesearchaeota archaeon]HIJ02313.1 glycosyltransferase family 4 protein [Candidatus Woesearchaeota archaeon]HIJ14210.1 glycosyltransferase family 4 protein [Candidatus Woesearchaeota archaeon]
MNILAISIASIFKEHIQGGSQRIFKNVMEYLSKDNTINVLCTRRDDNFLPFEVNQNFKVNPSLRFRQSFPFPYMTNPNNLANIIKKVICEAENADVIYVHADGFYFKKFLKVHHPNIPIITSLHDFVYPISISSAFIGDNDIVIVPSKYVFECMKHSVGQIYENLMNRAVNIENGVDTSIFYKDKSLTKQLKLRYNISDSEKVLLFPHRPEQSKGIDHSLNLTKKLVDNGEQIKLLFPKHIDILCSEDLQREYGILYDKISKLNLENHVSFFEWTLPNFMRHIYALGDITLNLGNFVESFGLVPLESLLCETPVIATKAGCLRYNLKNFEESIQIDYDDSDALMNAYHKIVNNKFEFKKTVELIKKNFSYENMLKQYKEVFLNAKVNSTLKLQKNGLSKDIFELAPWCYISEKGIYDDYIGTYSIRDKKIIKLLSEKTEYTREYLGSEFNDLQNKNILVEK